MSDSSIVIIQGTVGLYTVATRCHTCFAVTLTYTEDSSLTILRHSLVVPSQRELRLLIVMKPIALFNPSVKPYEILTRCFKSQDTNSTR